jgi:sec-independent protein translocase protein TatB
MAGPHIRNRRPQVLANLGWEEILLLAVIGLVVFGPDRLPKAIRDATRVLRELRAMAQSAANELKSELGPEMAEFDLRSLHPRRFVEDALFGDDNADSSQPAGHPAAVTTLALNERPPFDPDAT